MGLIKKIESTHAQAKLTMKGIAVCILADGAIIPTIYQAASRGDKFAAVAYTSAALAVAYISGKLVNEIRKQYK